MQALVIDRYLPLSGHSNLRTIKPSGLLALVISLIDPALASTAKRRALAGGKWERWQGYDQGGYPFDEWFPVTNWSIGEVKPTRFCTQCLDQQDYSDER